MESSLPEQAEVAPKGDQGLPSSDRPLAAAVCRAALAKVPVEGMVQDWEVDLPETGLHVLPA